MTECAKLAFADREAWYGDPDFTDVPVKALLSADYADARRQLVGAEASASLVPGPVSVARLRSPPSLRGMGSNGCREPSCNGSAQPDELSRSSKQSDSRQQQTRVSRRNTYLYLVRH